MLSRITLEHYYKTAQAAIYYSYLSWEKSCPTRPKRQTGLLIRAPRHPGRRDARRIGGAAVAGTVIGAIVGGGRGAAIGFAVGAGAGGAVTLATPGDEVEFPAEQGLAFTLSVPVEIHGR